MVRKAQALANLGELAMDEQEANDVIARVRRGQRVDPIQLQRAVMALYRGYGPRKKRLPVLLAAERMRVNAVLLYNIGNTRIQTLKENKHAGYHTAQTEVATG